jgi:hypothetical protein
MFDRNVMTLAPNAVDGLNKKPVEDPADSRGFRVRARPVGQGRSESSWSSSGTDGPCPHWRGARFDPRSALRA